jgi:death-on-curing protein
MQEDAYRGIHERAAALLHSLARSHALVDGNKRLVLAATIAFYGMNGIRLTLTNARAYDLVIDVASGRLDDVPAVASVLRRNRAAR